MKRTIVVLLTIMLMCIPFLTGCGDSNDDSSQSGTDQVQEETTENEEDSESERVIEYDKKCTKYESALAGHRYELEAGPIKKYIEFNSDGTYIHHESYDTDGKYEVAKIDGVYTVRLLDLATMDKELRIQGRSKLPEKLLNTVDSEFELSK